MIKRLEFWFFLLGVFIAITLVVAFSPLVWFVGGFGVLVGLSTLIIVCYMLARKILNR